MFDKIQFANILKKISETYNNQRDFSEKSDINRTYLSQYMNMKLDNPPKPNILKRLADNSNGIISYDDLMQICGYLNGNNDTKVFDSYEELNYLSDNRRKKIDEINLTHEENEIFKSLFDQLLDTGVYKGITPQHFDYENVLNDIDFISADSKNKIKQALYYEYFYLYNMRIIRHRIGNLRHNIKQQDDIQELNKMIQKEKFYMCPVYGKISAGLPNWAEECLEGYLPIDPNLMGIVNPEDCFFLRVDR